MFRISPLLWATLLALAESHTVITYPGWRGNNLDVTDDFPYGMQRSYPCGGIPLSTNRTNWPITGGGVAIQPGWFTGHAKSSISINLGISNDQTDGPDGGPGDFSRIMVPTFQITGPSDNMPFPGSFCLPQVPLPAGMTVKVGDQATIQVIETFPYGGALYNCVDVTFSLPGDVAELNVMNCFNSTDIKFPAGSIESTPAATIASSPTTSAASSTETILVRETETSCPPCPACPTATSCPNTNGNLGSKEGLGLGLPIGVLALGLLGL